MTLLIFRISFFPSKVSSSTQLVRLDHFYTKYYVFWGVFLPLDISPTQIT